MLTSVLNPSNERSYWENKRAVAIVTQLVKDPLNQMICKVRIDVVEASYHLEEKDV